MKKKTLIERLNNYFSAEENAIRVPPIENLQAYSAFPAHEEPPATRPVRRSARSIRRLAVVVACLAVLIAVAVILPAFIGNPESQSDGPLGNHTVNDFSAPQQVVTSGSGALKDPPSEGVEALDSDAQGGSDNNGNGMGEGGEGERYYPDELFNLLPLTGIVSVEEVLTAAEKLRVENAYYDNGQLPSLYLVIRELNIGKEEFIRVNDRNKKYPAVEPVYTDEQIDWLFSDADIQTVQAALKLDTALLYNGRLYTVYELLALEDSLLREMAGSEEMNAYLAVLDRYLCGQAEELRHRLEGIT